jgi:hypothetical protein
VTELNLFDWQLLVIPINFFAKINQKSTIVPSLDDSRPSHRGQLLFSNSHLSQSCRRVALAIADLDTLDCGWHGLVSGKLVFEFEVADFL